MIKKNLFILFLFILRDNLLLDLFNDIKQLDTVIYRVGCFRMPFCTKYGQDRHLEIISDHTFFNALKTHIPDDSELLDMQEDTKKSNYICTRYSRI